MPVNIINLKCYSIVGSIVNGIREPIFLSFNIDKPPGYKIIKEPSIIFYKKINTDKLSHIRFSRR